MSQVCIFFCNVCLLWRTSIDISCSLIDRFFCPSLPLLHDINKIMKTTRQLDIMIYVCTPSTLKAEMGKLSRFKASLVYMRALKVSVDSIVSTCIKANKQKNL